MTQQQLADAAHVSLKTISNLENESLTPQRGTLRKIRDALALSSDLAVAAEQAAKGVGAERVGLAPARRPRRTGLDGLLYDMENRMLDLEDRVTELERRLTDEATSSTTSGLVIEEDDHVEPPAEAFERQALRADRQSDRGR